MEAFLEREYYLRTSDFDRHRKIRPAAVMDLFQDVAGVHANQLGCGFTDLIGKNMMWVLVRVKFTVVASPEMFSSVTVRTWPLPPSRAGFRREYLMTDSDGNELIRGSSDWVIMHSEERKLIPAKDIYPFSKGFCTDMMHPDRLTKIKDFESDTPATVLRPVFSDLDMNGHVNNTKYLDFVMDVLAPDEPLCVKSLQIDYRKEILPDTEIRLQTQIDGDIFAKGTDSDGNVMFICRMER